MAARLKASTRSHLWGAGGKNGVCVVGGYCQSSSRRGNSDTLEHLHVPWVCSKAHIGWAGLLYRKCRSSMPLQGQDTTVWGRTQGSARCMYVPAVLHSMMPYLSKRPSSSSSKSSACQEMPSRPPAAAAATLPLGLVQCRPPPVAAARLTNRLQALQLLLLLPHERPPLLHDPATVATAAAALGPRLLPTAAVGAAAGPAPAACCCAVLSTQSLPLPYRHASVYLCHLYLRRGEAASRASCRGEVRGVVACSRPYSHRPARPVIRREAPRVSPRKAEYASSCSGIGGVGQQMQSRAQQSR